MKPWQYDKKENPSNRGRGYGGRGYREYHGEGGRRQDYRGENNRRPNHYSGSGSQGRRGYDTEENKYHGNSRHNNSNKRGWDSYGNRDNVEGWSRRTRIEIVDNAMVSIQKIYSKH